MSRVSCIVAGRTVRKLHPDSSCDRPATPSPATLRRHPPGQRRPVVYGDTQDFEKALELMGRYAKRYRVAIHGYCLLHNHAHWIFEASTAESISNLMRDMQGRYSFYLNRKYQQTPWLLIAPLYGCKDTDHFSPYLRIGPTNWTSRHDARFLDSKGFREFLRYVENNAVAAGLARRPTDTESLVRHWLPVSP